MNLEKFQKMYGNVVWTGKPHNFLGLPINFTRYIITDKKIVVRKGFLNIKEEKVELYRIIDMSKDLPISQRIFGCGTLKLSCKDVTLPNLELKQIKDPYAVHNLIEEKIEEQKKSYGVLGRDIVGAAMNIQGQDTPEEIDANGNGIPDYLENNIDIDGDGIPD